MERVQERSSIVEIITSVAEENGIKEYVITDVKTNQKGEGYLGEIFMVTINDKNTHKDFQMVIKAAFTEDKVREIAPIRKCFENEIEFYKTVCPVLETFGATKGINDLAYVPKCLKVCCDDREEMLVLENLRVSGFEMFDKTLMLSEDHIRLIFETYGKYHGYSAALQDQQPDEFKRITKKLHNNYEILASMVGFKSHMMEIAKSVRELLIPNEDEKIINKFDNYTDERIIDNYLEIVKHDEQIALLHGDCWSNNMMFKYAVTPTNEKRPVDIRLIDFQLVRAGSPVCDLSYCLYSGGSKKSFDNLNEHLRTYHNSFCKTVTALGSDPEQLYPFSRLLDHWKKYSRFGMIMALAILKMKLIHKDDIIDLTDDFNMEDIGEIFANLKFDKETYSKRIRGLLWHMYDVDAL